MTPEETARQRIDAMRTASGWRALTYAMRVILLSFLTAVLLGSAVARAQIHVPADHPTIQAAIDAAGGSGDSIIVSAAAIRRR